MLRYTLPPKRRLKLNLEAHNMQRMINFIGNDGIEYEIPGKYEVCDRCEGTGTHTNPNIDAQGLSHDLVDDPDFMRNYMAGVYDVTCTECNGKRVVLVVDEENTDPGELEKYYDAMQEISDINAEIEAERRFGA